MASRPSRQKEAAMLTYASNTKPQPLKSSLKDSKSKTAPPPVGKLEDIQKYLYKNFTFSHSQDVYSCNVLPRQVVRELIDLTTKEIKSRGKFAIPFFFFLLFFFCL